MYFWGLFTRKITNHATVNTFHESGVTPPNHLATGEDAILSPSTPVIEPLGQLHLLGSIKSDGVIYMVELETPCHDHSHTLSIPYLWDSNPAAMVSLARFPVHGLTHAPWVTEAPQRRRNDVARFAQRQHKWRWANTDTSRCIVSASYRC